MAKLSAILFGALLGAVLGALITELDSKKLRDEPKLAFRGYRFAKWWRSREYNWFTKTIWSATKLLVTEWIIIAFSLWLAIICLWWYSSYGYHWFSRDQYWLDRDWFREFFVGSIIGAIAAPWVWLHFSKTLGDSEVPSSEPPKSAPDNPNVANSGAMVQVGWSSPEFDAHRDPISPALVTSTSESAQNARSSSAKGTNITIDDSSFNRYRFLTISLGLLLVAAFLGDSLGDYLRGVTKIEAFGVAISQPERPSGTQGPALGYGPPLNQGGNTPTDKLTTNTDLARDISTAQDGSAGLEFVTNINDKAGLDVQSVWDRDRAYIAFLTFIQSPYDDKATTANNAFNRPTVGNPESYLSLDKYVATSLRIEKARYPGFEKYTEDDLTFITRTAPLFRCLSHYAKQIKDVHLYFIESSGFLKQYSIMLKEGKIDSDQFQISANELLDNINGILVRLSKFDPPSWTGGKLCEKIVDPSSAGIGGTPYPTLLGLYSLAAVESPETGILHLLKWIEDQKAAPSPRKKWYLFRAKIELSLMMHAALGDFIKLDRRISFQRAMTEELRELLLIDVAGGWSEFCKNFRHKTDIHTRLGRRLAMTYAVARSNLFELEDPVLIQARSKTNSPELISHLEDDLAESQEFLRNIDCFADVPLYDLTKEKWRAQFMLDEAQLRLGILGKAPESEKEDEVKRIRHIIELAQSLLGKPSVGAEERSPTNQLFGGQRFDDQRQRASRLLIMIAGPGGPR